MIIVVKYLQYDFKPVYLRIQGDILLKYPQIHMSVLCFQRFVYIRIGTHRCSLHCRTYRQWLLERMYWLRVYKQHLFTVKKVNRFNRNLTWLSFSSFIEINFYKKIELNDLLPFGNLHSPDELQQVLICIKLTSYIEA